MVYSHGKDKQFYYKSRADDGNHSVLKASKYLYFLVFITVYILFHYSYKSIFIVKISIVKMYIVTIITHKHSVKYRAREMETLQD